MIRYDNGIPSWQQFAHMNSPSFTSILDGRSHGICFVDDEKEPKLVVVYSPIMEGFSFFGHVNTLHTKEALSLWLQQDLKPFIMNQGLEDFEFSLEDEGLLTFFHGVYGNTLKSEMEYHYLLDNEATKGILLPNDYELKRIDEHFWNELEQGVYKNRLFLMERVTKSFLTLKRFLENSLGYCILHQGRIVGVVLGTSRFGDRIAVDIAVDKVNRQLGLGKALAQALVNGCIESAIVPQWSCIDSNVASQKLAEAVGFKCYKTNWIYWVVTDVTNSNS